MARIEPVEISVVVPYFNEANGITRTLGRIAAQTLKPKEVVLVNSSSTDNTRAVVDAWIHEYEAYAAARAHVIQFRNVHSGTRTPASSKNAGIRAAAFPWVAFMDCGLEFPPDWLETNARILAEEVQRQPGGGDAVVSGYICCLGANVIDACAVAQTYGYNRSRPCVPSTLMERRALIDGLMFIEGRRAGYDRVWPQQLRDRGVRRLTNSAVQLRYEGINFAPTLLRVFRKNFACSTPTVGLPCYHQPYLYFAVCAAGLATIYAVPSLMIVLGAGYVAARGFLMPALKSRGIRVFRDFPGALLLMPFVGAVVDAGRFLGIGRGIWRYHVRAWLGTGATSLH